MSETQDWSAGGSMPDSEAWVVTDLRKTRRKDRGRRTETGLDGVCVCVCGDTVIINEALPHTPSTAFRHFPPNSARFSYVTEGALFISAQLSTDAVSALRKVRVLIRLWKQPSAQART